MSATNAKQLDVVTFLASLLLMLALWLTTRPYLGAIDDSKLYTVQALNVLIPGRFAEDLYFRYGSQDHLSLFTEVYSPFIAAFGIADGNLALTVITQCIWLAGIFYFASGIFREPEVVITAVVAVIIIPGGPWFHYGESILTPRLLAEALSFWALGSMLRGKSGRSFLIICVSMTMHPLSSLPVLAVLFLYEALKHRILWAFGGIALVALLLLAHGGVPPFVWLTENFDPTWLNVVSISDPWCFITKWNLMAWLSLSGTIALSMLWLSLARTGERWLSGLVLTVAIGGLLVSLIGGDVFHNVLIFDIQAFRATWLLALTSHLYAGAMFFRIQRRGTSSLTNANILYLVGVGSLALSNFNPFFSVIATPMIIVACLVCGWEHRHDQVIPLAARLPTFLIIVIAGAMTIIFLYLSSHYLANVPIVLNRQITDVAISATALGTLWYILGGGGPSRLPLTRWITLLSVALALVVISIAGWDQRSAWTKYIDSTKIPPISLTSLLPGETPIYWEGDVTAPWFLLKRPSYFSCEQSTGVLFSRSTAINYQARFNSFQPLGTLDFTPNSSCPSLTAHSAPVINLANLLTVCQNNPGLGTLILTERVADSAAAVWNSPVAFEYIRIINGKMENIKVDRFYIYSCTDLRR